MGDKLKVPPSCSGLKLKYIILAILLPRNLTNRVSARYKRNSNVTLHFAVTIRYGNHIVVITMLRE
jgi:hypothetical protein